MEEFWAPVHWVSFAHNSILPHTNAHTVHLTQFLSGDTSNPIKKGKKRRRKKCSKCAKKIHMSFYHKNRFLLQTAYVPYTYSNIDPNVHILRSFLYGISLLTGFFYISSYFFKSLFSVLSVKKRLCPHFSPLSS